ncbi:hypothetical protein J8273_5511 [Carpediemonas membranifera]|uniref:Uncharacterized protein n=1 Tax=Carpediemonas membranifera TaxID=201153 RepID=A0A8J6B1W9_9EUKA|nr:hypothetical protein J8273_5511 [Carpediemonas membranifera]|eukprot:KAG9392509.1 hypothetical protein J8273_5511 [Carpediemonas membranifera]
MEGKGDHPNTYKVMDLVSKCVATVHADRLVTFHADGLTEKELEEIAAYEQDEQPASPPDEDSYIPYNRYYDQLEAIDSYLELNPGLKPMFESAKKKFRRSGRR